MINVQIQPFARNLMTAYIGAIAYQQRIIASNQNQIARERTALEKAKRDQDMWTDMSFDLTVGMIDKRFKESKNFIESSGASGSLRFKKTLSETERRLQYVMQQNMLKTRTKYENIVSSYNQRLNDKKMRASVKQIDLRKFV